MTDALLARIAAALERLAPPPPPPADLTAHPAYVWRGHALAPARAFAPLPLALLRGVDHEPTHRAVAAERAFLAALGGDCRSPVAAYARWLADGTLRLDAEIYSEDGADHAIGETLVPDPAAAEALARRLLVEAPESVRRLFAA